MSYLLASKGVAKAGAKLLARRALNKKRRPVKRAMGDFWQTVEDLIAPGPDAILSAASPTCGLDAGSIDMWYAQIANVGTTWNPTDSYTLADYNSVVSQVMTMINVAAANMTSVASINNTDTLQQATSDLSTQYAYGVNFQAQAAAAAQQGVTVMTAPQLKQWVIDSMSAALVGTVAAGAAACDSTTWQVWWAATTQGLQQTIAVVTAIAGVVAAAADKVMQVVGGAFSLISWLEQYGVYVALGIGAIWLYSSYEKGHSAR